MKKRGALKDRLAGIAHGLGYTVIPNWRLDTFASAAFLRRLFAHLEIDCVIDVGANAGQYHDFLRSEVGFEGLIASYAPVTHLAAALKRAAAADSKWLVHHCALGSVQGERDFNVMAGSEFSSFLKPIAETSFRGANRVTQTVKTTVDTLDNVVPELRRTHGVKKIYLKLDTQGFDLEVLKGGEAALPTISGLQSEVCVKPIYEGMPRFTEVIAYLEARGFQMSGIFPNNAGHFPLLLEFDCYMVRGQDAAAIH